MNGELLRDIGASLVGQLPVYLVYLAGLVFAILKYGKHPKPSLLAILALAGLLVTSIGGTVVTLSVIHSQRQSGEPYSAITTQLGILGVIRSLFFAASIGLLVAAVYTGRTSAKQRPRDDDDDDEPREKRDRAPQRKDAADAAPSEQTVLPIARAKPPTEPRTD